MPSENMKILEFNQNQKYYKGQSVICKDLECLISHFIIKESAEEFEKHFTWLV